MGIIPSVLFELVDFTPYALRYLMTSTGEAGSTVLPNAAGVNPDLRTDASRGSEWGPVPVLYHLLTTPVADQNEARRVLCGEFGLPVAPPGNHAQTTLCRRGQVGIAGPIVGPSPPWTVDANEGAAAGHAPSAGYAVLVVTPPDDRAGDAECYLHIHFKWSRRDGTSLIVPAGLPFTPPQ